MWRSPVSVVIIPDLVVASEGGVGTEGMTIDTGLFIISDCCAGPHIGTCIPTLEKDWRDLQLDMITRIWFLHAYTDSAIHEKVADVLFINNGRSAASLCRTLKQGAVILQVF